LARQGQIVRADGQPLGGFADLERFFLEVFPGIKFGLDHGPRPAGANAFDIQGWLSKMKGTKFPAWVGLFETRSFIISFRLEGEQPVIKGQFNIYGHGIADARKRLDQLVALTGWRIET